MRVMVIIKATKASENGEMPSQQLLSEMMAFNEELVNSGMMLAGDGLQPSAKGKRVRFDGKKRVVVDGPFAETQELIAGYWILRVQSMDDAVSWVKRIPNPDDETGEVEIRPLFEIEDFENATPEIRAQEARLRRQTAELNRS